MWPFKRQKELKSSSNSSQGDLDRLYSISRRLERRVMDMELMMSAMKRDVARIDRKQYRDAEVEPASEEPVPATDAVTSEALLKIWNSR